MLDVGNLPLFAAQDALLAALRTWVETPLGVTVDLGQPTNLQPEHVWIKGDSEGQALYEDTGSDPSQQTFTITLLVLCTYAAEDYATTRARFATILAGVTTALASAGFAASVDQARATEWEVDEGRDGEGVRQLGMRLEIECDKW